MILVLGTLRFPPQNMTQIRPHLRTLVDETNRIDGPIAYDVGEDPFDPGLIRFSEVWTDTGILDRHLQAPHIAPWRAICAQFGASGRSFTLYQADSGRPL
jgi:quinol monooxygenase YgiN